MDINDEIFERARLMFRGELSEGDEAVLREMCLAACGELCSRLCAGVLLEDIHERFVRAAATLGISLYAGMEPERGVGSFSAGSVRVSRRSGKESRDGAALLRKQAELMLLGLISDDGFSFRAVSS